MNFYQQELNIFPRKNVLYAISYIMKLLGILLKQKENKELYYKDVLKAMKKQLDRFSIKGPELKNVEKCEAIIAEFNNSCSLSTEDDHEEVEEATTKTPVHGFGGLGKLASSLPFNNLLKKQEV